MFVVNDKYELEKPPEYLKLALDTAAATAAAAGRPWSVHREIRGVLCHVRDEGGANMFANWKTCHLCAFIGENGWRLAALNLPAGIIAMPINYKDAQGTMLRPTDFGLYIDFAVSARAANAALDHIKLYKENVFNALLLMNSRDCDKERKLIKIPAMTYEYDQDDLTVEKWVEYLTEPVDLPVAEPEPVPVPVAEPEPEELPEDLPEDLPEELPEELPEPEQDLPEHSHSSWSSDPCGWSSDLCDHEPTTSFVAPEAPQQQCWWSWDAAGGRWLMFEREGVYGVRVYCQLVDGQLWTDGVVYY
jgi:hypothetical protein